MAKLDDIEIPTIYSLYDADARFRELLRKQFAKKFVTPGAKDELDHYVRCGHTISLTIHPSFVSTRLRIIKQLHKRRGTTPVEQE